MAMAAKELDSAAVFRSVLLIFALPLLKEADGAD